MKPRLTVSFFLLGLTSLVSQVVIQRLMMVGFYGNELFVGVVLASWLFWTAMGSGIFGGLLKSDRAGDDPSTLYLLHMFTGFVFLAQIFIIQYVKGLIAAPGEIPDIAWGLVAALLIPAPISFLLGTWWAVASRICSECAGFRAVNRGYFIEIAGFAIGGVLFSFLLVRLEELFLADILIAANALVAVCLTRSNVKRTAAALLLAASVAFAFTPYIDRLQASLSGLNYRHQQLAESVNTPYGNIAVTKTGAQYNFYEDGVLSGSTEKTSSAEDIAHFALLEHPDPRRVLLIGGGYSGVVFEILKEPVEEVVYTEIDPGVVDAAMRYLPAEYAAALSDPKVRTINTDGYHLLKSGAAKFDVIILNLPPPSTALLNRYYTRDFFELARSRLAEDGLFATILPYTPSAPNDELVTLCASILKSLESVFSETFVIADETVIYLASDGGMLTRDPETMIGRFRDRKIEANFISDGYLRYRMENDRNEEAAKLFAKADSVKINTNFVPAAYFYQNLYWLDLFHHGLAKSYMWIAPRLWIVAACALVLAAAYLAARRRSPSKAAAAASVATAGFSLMTLEMIVVFSYQIYVGYLYYRIALIISALMMGMAAGVLCANAIAVKTAWGRKSLVAAHLLMIAFCALLPLALGAIGSAHSTLTVEAALLACSFAAGFLGAAVFPISNMMYLAASENPCAKTGVIYAADLAGSCLGALLPSVVLIPLYGINASLAFTIALNACAILVLLFSSLQRPVR